MAALAGSQAPLLLGAIPKQNGVPGCSEASVPPRTAQLEDSFQPRWLVRVRPQSMAVIHAPAAVPGSPPCTCAISMQYPSEPALSRLKIEPSHGRWRHSDNA